MSADWIERTMDDWETAYGEVDRLPPEIVLRVLLLGRSLERRVEESLAPLGLHIWEFDVLAALRRQGAPYCLSSGELARQMVITCSGITHRVSRLAGRGLVSRSSGTSDRRTVYVTLTEAGVAAVATGIDARREDETELLAGLDTEQRRQLIHLLKALRASDEASAGGY